MAESPKCLPLHPQEEPAEAPEANAADPMVKDKLGVGHPEALQMDAEEVQAVAPPPKEDILLATPIPLEQVVWTPPGLSTKTNLWM